MSETSIDRYRASAARWRKEAEEAATNEARRNCLTVAEGYERLIQILSSATNPVMDATPKPDLQFNQPFHLQD
jgi:hypothetical protein